MKILCYKDYDNFKAGQQYEAIKLFTDNDTYTYAIISGENTGLRIEQDNTDYFVDLGNTHELSDVIKAAFAYGFLSIVDDTDTLPGYDYCDGVRCRYRNDDIIEEFYFVTENISTKEELFKTYSINNIINLIVDTFDDMSKDYTDVTECYGYLMDMNASFNQIKDLKPYEFYLAIEPYIKQCEETMELAREVM